MRSLTDQARFLAADRAARSAAQRHRRRRAETLERRQSSIETRYPFVSIAVVPVSGLTCQVEPARAARVPRTLPVKLPVDGRALVAPGCAGRAAEVGPLRRLLRASSPTTCRPRRDGPQAHTRLVMRAVALPEVPNPTWAVVLDLPLSPDRGASASSRRPASASARSPPCRSARARTCCRSRAIARARAAGSARQRADLFAHHAAVGRLPRLHRLGHRRRSRACTLAIRINAWSIYDRLSVVSASVGELNFGQLLLACWPSSAGCS